MSMTVKDVIDWLRTLPADDAIYIDEGGLNLMSEMDPDAYLEVGGQALEDEEDEDEDDSIFEDEEDGEINEGDDDEWEEYEDDYEEDDWGDEEDNR